MAYNVTATRTSFVDITELPSVNDASQPAMNEQQTTETRVATSPKPSRPLIKADKQRLYNQPYTSDRPAAFIRRSWFSDTTLDLHTKRDKTSPILAHCRPSSWPSRFILSFGDHEVSPERVQNTVMVSQSFWSMEFTISLVLEGSPQLRTFRWRRTKRVGICGLQLESWSAKNFKLVDEEDNVVAVFNRPSLSWHTLAILEVIPDLGRTFEHIVWISILGYYVMRRAREGYNAGGGSAVAC
ncbi:hypothetical protein CC79DRAFT_1372396 [Sarocladium strictum]